LIQQAARNAAPLVPTEFEVAFGGRGAQPGRKEGLNVGPAHVSGKIDRIDADPAFTARAMVVDYKTSTISTGAQIMRDGKLQIPLYLLALREVLGREPVGGLLVSIRKGHVRGIVDVDELDVLPANISREDRLSHDEFEAALEAARSEAAARVLRIRDGDVRHDPQTQMLCERFCDYRGICRVER
jgi:ATP-dependent helicase/DNAse subunit B